MILRTIGQVTKERAKQVAQMVADDEELAALTPAEQFRILRERSADADPDANPYPGSDD